MQPADPLSIAVPMLFYIPVVYVGVDVRKQLAADLIRLAIEDDDVNHHIFFKQKTADRVDSYFERLILWIAEDFRGDQRECDRLATMLLCERE